MNIPSNIADVTAEILDVDDRAAEEPRSAASQKAGLCLGAAVPIRGSCGRDRTSPGGSDAIVAGMTNIRAIQTPLTDAGAQRLLHVVHEAYADGKTFGSRAEQTQALCLSLESLLDQLLCSSIALTSEVEDQENRRQKLEHDLIAMTVQIKRLISIARMLRT